MSKDLVIVESPAKAKTISRYLAGKYKVMASVGHVKDLPKKELGVDVDDNFKPTYVVIKGKGKILNEIKTASKNAKVVYLAPDPDREGEAIAWHIAEEIKKFGGKKAPEIHRAMFNEITSKAVREAIQNPKELTQSLFDAQQARRILDRIVGYKISPLLWKKVRRGLSAGRVQSVAVRLVCEREDAIEAFVSDEYWSIVANLDGRLPPSFESKLLRVDGKEAKIGNDKTANGYVSEIKKQKFILTGVKKKQRKRNPAPPFITSKLQQEAARKLGFTAKKTMAMAQMLYEGVDLGDGERVGLITYMRTDSPRLADSALVDIRNYIAKQYGKEFVPEKPKYYKGKKSAQEAHEAVRPTSMDRPPEAMANYLERDQLRLYDLIWKRCIASQMVPAVYDQTAFDIEAGRFLFRATGSVLRNPGFIAVYLEGVDDAKEKNEEENPTLPDLQEGEELKLKAIEPHQHFTQPPPRFSEASLVKELEEKGIGRPSTYAAILSTIQDKEYVRKQEGRFHPSELGRMVNNLLVENFPNILDVGFTAKLEDELDEIEDGKIEWVKTLKAFYNKFAKTLKKAEAEMKDIKKQAIKTGLECPLCGGGLVIKWGRHGEFLACLGYPTCRHTSEMTRNDDGTIVARKREEKKIEEKCPDCGASLTLKRGRYGEFIACTKYPDCKFTKSITLGVKCPKCSKGEIVQRNTKRGKTFYGCERYPNCDFASWDKPVNKKCEKCESPIMVEKWKKGGDLQLLCPECDIPKKKTGAKKDAAEKPTAKKTKKVTKKEGAEE